MAKLDQLKALWAEHQDHFPRHAQDLLAYSDPDHAQYPLWRALAELDGVYGSVRHHAPSATLPNLWRVTVTEDCPLILQNDDMADFLHGQGLACLSKGDVFKKTAAYLDCGEDNEHGHLTAFSGGGLIRIVNSTGHEFFPLSMRTDVGTLSGLDGLANTWPERVILTEIGEESGLVLGAKDDAMVVPLFYVDTKTKETFISLTEKKLQAETIAAELSKKLPNTHLTAEDIAFAPLAVQELPLDMQHYQEVVFAVGKTEKRFTAFVTGDDGFQSLCFRRIFTLDTRTAGLAQSYAHLINIDPEFGERQTGFMTRQALLDEVRDHSPMQDALRGLASGVIAHITLQPPYIAKVFPTAQILQI